MHTRYLSFSPLDDKTMVSFLDYILIRPPQTAGTGNQVPRHILLKQAHFDENPADFVVKLFNFSVYLLCLEDVFLRQALV